MAAPAIVATPSRTGWDDTGKLILRVTVAVLLVLHGISKLQHGISWMGGMLQSHHIPAFVGYGVYVAEVVAPILLGYFVYAEVRARRADKAQASPAKTAQKPATVEDKLTDRYGRRR